VRASDEVITFAADGVALQLKRVWRVEPGGRIALEIQARAGSFGGSYATEVRIDELLRFASELGATEHGRGGIRTATLRNATNEGAIEVTLNTGDAATGRYLFRSQTLNGLSAELSGSFVADGTMLNTLARELISLIHDSWAKA